MGSAIIQKMIIQTQRRWDNGGKEEGTEGGREEGEEGTESGREEGEGQTVEEEEGEEEEEGGEGEEGEEGTDGGRRGRRGRDRGWSVRYMYTVNL